MAYRATIGGEGTLFLGEDKTLRFEVLDDSEAPVNVASWDLLWVVRDRPHPENEPVRLQKTVTVSGVFNSVRASNTQRAIVELTDTDTASLRNKTYAHSLKRVDDGSETVLAFGPFVVEATTQG
jgi:hypothetical protein